MNANALETFFKDCCRHVEHTKVVVSTAVAELQGRTIRIEFAVKHLLVSGWGGRSEKQRDAFQRCKRDFKVKTLHREDIFKQPHRVNMLPL